MRQVDPPGRDTLLKKGVIQAMKQIKVGIIGMGFIGAAHIDALRRVGGVELVAVADARGPAACLLYTSHHLYFYRRFSYLYVR